MNPDLNLVERRQDREPRVSQGRTVFIIVDDSIAQFDIVNMSMHGVAGRCDRTLSVGQHVSFQFDNGEYCVGQVRWVNVDKVGIYFSRALPTSIIYGAETRNEFAPRAPRYAATRRAMIKVASFQRPAIIRNVSTGGMMIETSLQLNIQQVVTVFCAEVAFVASVRWTAGNLAGIKLRETLDLTAFDELSRPGPDLIPGER